ncbi:MAG: hypothetical protein JNK58_07000 [Phycisphaerae bacterium]|nr:hypothetical protein [Phycisphaerae bacterium]
MKKFPGCDFGPMQLRAALRAGREPGERLIGWGTGRLALERSAELFLAGLMHVPVVGVLLAAGVAAKQARFFVLTDRRFLIFRVERAAIRRADRAVALSLGHVSLAGGRTSILNGNTPFRAVSAGKSYLIHIARRRKSRPVRRLVEGLRVLADDDQPTPDADNSSLA